MHEDHAVLIGNVHPLAKLPVFTHRTPEQTPAVNAQCMPRVAIGICGYMYVSTGRRPVMIHSHFHVHGQSLLLGIGVWTMNDEDIGQHDKCEASRAAHNIDIINSSGAILHLLLTVCSACEVLLLYTVLVIPIFD